MDDVSKMKEDMLQLLRDIRDREISGKSIAIVNLFDLAIWFLVNNNLIETGIVEDRKCYVLTFTGHVFLAAHDEKAKNKIKRS